MIFHYLGEEEDAAPVGGLADLDALALAQRLIKIRVEETDKSKGFVSDSDSDTEDVNMANLGTVAVTIMNT